MSDSVPEPGGTATNLLWTGGWDSTFRLLDLVLVRRRRVQPYYLIDTERPSFGFEIKAMRAIRDQLPSGRVSPTIFRDIADIGENRSISDKYQRLAARSYIGSQYDWIARFAAEARLEEIELAIERDGRFHALVEPHVEPDEDGYILKSDGDADLSIFRPFRFPILDLSKLDQQQEAERHGFRELLEQTWFCHTPTSRGRPCGECRPCQYIRSKGLTRRIPVSGHFRYYKSRFRRRLTRTPGARPLVALARRRTGTA
jgi:hypothetical protein